MAVPWTQILTGQYEKGQVTPDTVVNYITREETQV